jgi:hypothetical protein
MADDNSGFHSERVYQADDIAGQLKYVVCLQRLRPIRLAITTHIRRDHSIPGVRQWTKLMPPSIPGLRKSMQKHNQRAIAYIGVMHSDSVGHDELMADLAFKHASPEDNGSSHMPIAALYDIHGNLPALEAVFAEIRQLEYTREMEEVRARGELRTNSFVRFRRILINEESKIEIENLGRFKGPADEPALF